MLSPSSAAESSRFIGASPSVGTEREFSIGTDRLEPQAPFCAHAAARCQAPGRSLLKIPLRRFVRRLVAALILSLSVLRAPDASAQERCEEPVDGRARYEH